MGLDTANVKAPAGLPHLLWALFTHAKASHIQSHTSVGSNFNSGNYYIHPLKLHDKVHHTNINTHNEFSATQHVHTT